jgi:hypothetical protein
VIPTPSTALEQAGDFIACRARERFQRITAGFKDLGGSFPHLTDIRTLNALLLQRTTDPRGILR